MPIIAAIGGMIAPAAVYLAVTWHDDGALTHLIALSGVALVRERVSGKR